MALKIFCNTCFISYAHHNVGLYMPHCWIPPDKSNKWAFSLIWLFFRQRRQIWATSFDFTLLLTPQRAFSVSDCVPFVSQRLQVHNVYDFIAVGKCPCSCNVMSSWSSFHNLCMDMALFLWVRSRCLCYGVNELGLHNRKLY